MSHVAAKRVQMPAACAIIAGMSPTAEREEQVDFTDCYYNSNLVVIIKKKFPAMYNAFTYGAPPHAGIAPGVDRMVMLLAGEESIREIIPFPMNKNAQDILMGAPSEVTQKQLDELHIVCTAKEEE